MTAAANNNGKKSKVILPPSQRQPSSLSSRQRERLRLPITVRLTILGACAGWLFQDTFQARLLPYGPPQHWGDRPTYDNLDLSNDSLMLKRTYGVFLKSCAMYDCQRRCDE